MQQQFQTAQETDMPPPSPQAIEETPADVTPAALERIRELVRDSALERALAQEALTSTAQLIKRLRRRSPIRDIAEALLHRAQSRGGMTPTSWGPFTLSQQQLMYRDNPLETIAPLLNAFAHPSDSRWKERTVAAWALGEVALAPEQQEEVVRVLSAVLTNKHRAGARLFSRLIRLSGRSFLVSSSIIGALLLYAMIPSSNVGIKAPEFLLLWEPPIWIEFLVLLLCYSLGGLLFVLPFTLPISLAFDIHGLNNVRQEAAATLGRLRDPRAIAALAAAMHDRSLDVRLKAEPALRQIMPLLTAEHYGQLSAQTVPNLCRLLTHWNENFVLLVLKALDKIGTGSAVSAVEALAQNGPTTTLRKEAARTLSTLQERQQREHNAQNLLRASQPSSPEMLLRAANPISETAAEELLRSANLPATEAGTE